MTSQPAATFQYQLNQKARLLIGSGEHVTIIGRTEYLEHSPTYLVRYLAKDMHAIEITVSESSLQPIED